MFYITSSDLPFLHILIYVLNNKHVFEVDPWPMRKQGWGCTDRDRTALSVENQIQCQAECELKNGCVGITFSHTTKNLYGNNCVICYNTVTEEVAIDGFNFYKMPGVKGIILL